MKKKYLASIIAGALVISAAGISQAATISYNDTFTFSSLDFWARSNTAHSSAIEDRHRSTNITLPGFDTSLGALTGVDITYDTDWSLLAYVQARDVFNNNGLDYTQGQARAGNSMLIDLVTPNGGAQSRDEVETTSCRAASDSPPECSNDSYDTGNFDGVIDISSLSYSDFTNNVLTLSISQTLRAQAFTPITDAEVYAWNMHNGWHGTIDVTYSYDEIVEPTPTPEPATVLLFGTGLMGLLGNGLRRRK